MAAAKETGAASGRAPGRALRRLSSALLLLAVGLSVGIVTGTVSNVPELLYRWLQGGSRVVELGEEPGPAPDFEALGQLQAPSKASERARSEPPAPVRSAAPKPERAEPPPRAEVAAAPSRVSAEPSPAPAAPPAAPDTSAASVIADIARRQESPGANTGSGRVVQVASYTDPRSAEALVRRLRKQGYDSFVSKTQAGGSDRYRVRVRPPGGSDEKQVASDLESRGFSVWVTSE